MDISIRPAISTDSEALATLTGQLGYSCSAEEAAACLVDLAQGRDMILVAESSPGKVLGWIHLSFATSLSTGAFAIIVGLVVDAECRGQGIGKALVAAAIDYAKSAGIGKVRVRSKSTRLDAHRFYRGIGFEEKKEQKVFDLNLF